MPPGVSTSLDTRRVAGRPIARQEEVQNNAEPAGSRLKRRQGHVSHGSSGSAQYSGQPPRSFAATSSQTNDDGRAAARPNNANGCNSRPGLRRFVCFVLFAVRNGCVPGADSVRTTRRLSLPTTRTAEPAVPTDDMDAQRVAPTDDPAAIPVNARLARRAFSWYHDIVGRRVGDRVTWRCRSLG